MGMVTGWLSVFTKPDFVITTALALFFGLLPFYFSYKSKILLRSITSASIVNVPFFVKLLCYNLQYPLLLYWNIPQKG